MSLLDRWRKAVKTKSKTLLNAPSTAQSIEHNKYSYENAIYKGSTASLAKQHLEDSGRSRKKSEIEKQDDSGKELKRSETFTLKDGPPDDVFYETGSTDYTNYGTYKKDKRKYRFMLVLLLVWKRFYILFNCLITKIIKLLLCYYYFFIVYHYYYRKCT